MAACDKLHKLYSSTSEPVVWARSVGVEVLNELDSVKAALMLNAGSRSSRARLSGRQVGVNFAADAVESIARSLSGVDMLTRGVAGMVGEGVQRVLQSVANSQRKWHLRLANYPVLTLSFPRQSIATRLDLHISEPGILDTAE